MKSQTVAFRVQVVHFLLDMLVLFVPDLLPGLQLAQAAAKPAVGIGDRLPEIGQPLVQRFHITFHFLRLLKTQAVAFRVQDTFFTHVIISF